MTLYRVRLIGEINDGVPGNVTSMSWGVDAAGVPSAESLWDALLAIGSVPSLTTSWRGNIASSWGTKAMEVRGAAGGPILDYYEMPSVTGTSSSAHAPQTSIIVQSIVQRGFFPQRVGRLMFGPIASNTGAGRPTSGTVNELLAFCENWHGQLVTLGCTPTYLSQGGTVGEEIIGYAIGNAYGAVKSRRSEVTSRSTLML